MSDKATIRNRVTRLRDSIGEGERQAKDRTIIETIFGIAGFAEAETVLLYASFRSEVQTGKIIARTLKEGKTTVLPLVNRQEKRLSLRRIQRMEDLIIGYMGIPEPRSIAAEVDLKNIDCVLVPGVAYDLHCFRIGYGGGYYDRLLGGGSPRPFLLAPAYEEQIVDDIPVDEHDVRMDMIVTEKRVIECSNN